MRSDVSCQLSCALFFVVLAAVACEDGGGPEPPGPPDAVEGELELTFSTNGVDLDADGYLVRIDTGSSLRVASDGAVRVSELAPGLHEVGLSDVADNCAVNGDNPRSVAVEANVLDSVSFQVTCSPLFDGSTVDLEGTWILSDTTQPKGGTAPGGITNECRLSNVPIKIIPFEPPDRWSAEQQEGGTIACELNGVWGPETPLTVRYGYSINKTGADMHWWLSSRFSHYVGALTSANEMKGAVDPDGYGRQGRWAARRQ